MKKVLFTTCLVFTTLFTFGQEESTVEKTKQQLEETVEQDQIQKSRFGVKAGYSSVAIDLGPISLAVDGFHAGVMAEFPISKMLFIQAEGLYVRGGEANIIQVPILTKYYVIEKLNLQAGPQMTYFIGDEDVDDKSFGIDMVIGAAFDITEDFFIDARYAFGLTNRGDETSFFNYKVNTFQIGAGYKF